MSQSKNIAVVLIAIFVASAALSIFADDSAAVDDISMGNFSSSGFSDNSDGTLSFNVTCNSGDARLNFVVKEGSQIVGSATEDLRNGESRTIGISFRLGTGSHDLVVTASGNWIDQDGNYIGTIAESDVSGSGSSIHVDVSASFWSGWVPYVALVFVALVIALMLYIWIRNRPKSKPALTFSDLEEGKVVAPAPAAETGKKKYEAGGSSAGKTTERLKYTSDRRK